MTDLPLSLRPWARQLAIFPQEIALLLGGLAAQLASLLGGGEPARSHEGAPDGFRGLSRHGTYDRLLMSEWLLQEELPDEFLRRVVSSEHSFLERAFTEESAHRSSFVLFDSGASQLGAPRIVQLAALIVLAQRAERQKGTLAWGSLQDASSTIHDSVNANVMKLVRLRSSQRPTDADFERWKAVVTERTVSELWFVGSERLAEEGWKQTASLLAVSEILESTAPHRVRVMARPHARAPQSGRVRSVTLELPPQGRSVQILRDPFASAVAPRQATNQAIDPNSNIVFSMDARRLHVRGTGGIFITFSIPSLL